MLINGQEGVLSIGGTGARAVELVEQQTKDELDYFGAAERGQSPHEEASRVILKRGITERKPILDGKTDWELGWQWSKVQGAEGWWQILMQGVWVDGAKVLQNQAAVIDVGVFTSSVRLRFENHPTNHNTNRLTVPSSSPHHSPPKPFTPPFLARAHCRPRTRTFTYFHASTHRNYNLSSASGISRLCRVGVGPTGQESPGGNLVWEG